MSFFTLKKTYIAYKLFRKVVNMNGFKNKMKKATALLLSLALMLVSGCGGDTPADTSDTTAATTGVPVTDENGVQVTDVSGNPVYQVPVTDESGAQVTDENGNPVYEIPEEAPVYKVGFIYNNKLEDGATNKIFESARDEIERTLGLETCYIDESLVSDIPEAVFNLKEYGCNIIVSCSPMFANSITKEADVDKDTYFLNFGGKDSGQNMSSFGGALYQSASVCGIAAAHNTTSNVIGVLADPGEFNMYGVVNGFTLGAAEIWGVYTDVRVNLVWSKDEDKIEEAIDNLAEQGCDVIMTYVENDHAVQYCNEKGIKVIGNSCDIPELAPDTYLSGYFFNFGTYLVDEIRSITTETFISEIYRGDIASGCARLVDFSDNCKEGTDTISTRLYDYIKAGKAPIFEGEIKNKENTVMVEKGQIMTYDNIMEIDWFIQGVRSVGNFTVVHHSPVPGELEIKQ